MQEDRTPQPQSWLSLDVVAAASALVRTELRRAALRVDLDLLPAVEDVLARLHLLRSVDALHVATAVRAGVDGLVTYDHRMTQAAESAGVGTVAP